jgi:transaldolase
VEGARTVMANLEAAGISIETVTADLVTAGVKQFEDAFSKLLAVTHPQ